MYTKHMVNEAAKILWFEGAGCAERGNVENCRIRTALRNDAGKVFYLELTGVEVTKHTPYWLKSIGSVGYVDYCFEVGEDNEQRYRFDVERRHFEYSKSGILDFVNDALGCSYTELRIADEFYGYMVHGAKESIRILNDYDFDEEHAKAARDTFHEFDIYVREKLNEKYSNISYVTADDDSITVRFYASDKKMMQGGFNPEQRLVDVPLGWTK